MIYKGQFSFNRRKHPGEVEIINNNIYLTINESDINGYKKKINGIAGNKHMTIYGCRLVDHGIGYYKYQASHINIGSNIKYGNVDFVNSIQDFRFTFSPLNDWLNIIALNDNEESIGISIPADINLYNSSELKITIKYFREGNVYGNAIDKLRIKPYICVETAKRISVNKVREFIQIITRFFAILIGYSENISVIKYHRRYNGRVFFETLEDELIINSDFSNCNYIKDGYIHKFRTSYKELPYTLEVLFGRWLEEYKKYKEAIVVYFNPYSNHVLEEDFLTITKSIEKVHIIKFSQIRNFKKNKKFHTILKKFYKKYKLELTRDLKKSDFKKKYIQDIETIHEEIANSMVYKYDNRVDLAKRIKDLDYNCELVKRFKTNHVTSIDYSKTVYNYIANTRNYFTHLDKKKFIIKDIYIPGYNRILEKIFVGEILKLIISDNEYINKCLQRDPYLTLYDDIDY